jgi:hypothetical protein
MQLCGDAGHIKVLFLYVLTDRHIAACPKEGERV